jgi:homoserine O-acetyltransferase
LLDHLGVRHLVAVAGPSYGGYQAFQWAVVYPDFMDAIVAVNTAPWASVNTDKQLAELQTRLASDAEWYGGRYYGKAACKRVLTDIRVETLKRYGIETALAPRFPDPAARDAAIREQAANWAAKWDANSLIILRRALLGFDTRPDFARIKAKVLYILCRTDALFPPKIAPDVIKALTAARRAISSWTAISAIPPAAPSTPNGRQCYASSWRRWSAAWTEALRRRRLASSGRDGQPRHVEIVHAGGVTAGDVHGRLDGHASEEPMVCTTLRWRGVDSNFQFRDR